MCYLGNSSECNLKNSNIIQLNNICVSDNTKSSSGSGTNHVNSNRLKPFIKSALVFVELNIHHRRKQLYFLALLYRN